MAHDQTFKELLQAFFEEFMELFFPQVARRLDFRQVTFLDKEVFTDIPDGERRELDLVAEIGLRGGGEEVVLIHTELQRDRPLAFRERMCRYYWLLRLRRNKPVFPIVLYLAPGAGGLATETYEERFFADDPAAILTFRYCCIGVPDLAAAEYVSQANPLAPALAALMDAGDLRRPWLKARSLEGVARAPVDAARQSLLVNVIEIYLPLSDTEQREFEELVGREEMAEARAMLTTYEERGYHRGREEGREEGRKEGRKEGREQGREEGRMRGKRDWLLRTLRLKFGVLPVELEARVAGLTREAELDAYLERVLRAASLQETGL